MVKNYSVNPMHARKVIVGYLHSEGRQHPEATERFHDATNDITDRDKAMRRYNDYKKRVIQTSTHPSIMPNDDVSSFFKGLAVAVFIVAFILTIGYVFFK